MAGSDNRDRRDTGTEETREAVLADVRAHCKLLKDAGFDGDAYDIRVLVERLDAAWKLELESVTKRNGLGNAAKLREALDELIDYLNSLRTPDEIEHYVYSNLFDICDAALAAPPRNCDRFATADEAREAWWQEEILPRVHGQKAGVELAYHKWLFAPAAQEGGRQ